MKYRLLGMAMLLTASVSFSAYADDTEEVTSNETVFEANEQTAETERSSNNSVFTDVPEEEWYSESVDFVVKRKIMCGTSQKEFSPLSEATRGMLAVVIKNIEGTNEKAYWSYLDVNENAWHADSIAWCSEHGILNGYGGGKFGPEDSITREQLISTLYRYAEYRGFSNMETNGVELLEYDDYADISGYAGGSMQWALKNGIICGIDGRLEPKSVADRAQTAQIIRNFMIFYNL